MIYKASNLKMKAVNQSLLNRTDVFLIIFKNWANPGLFFVYFRSFQTNNTILQQMNVKNVMSIQYPAPGFEPTTFGM